VGLGCFNRTNWSMTRESGVFRFVNDVHASSAELAQDLVVADELFFHCFVGCKMLPLPCPRVTGIYPLASNECFKGTD